MKHLRIFNSIEEFEAAKPSMETPYVVLDEATGKVIYSNLVEITEDDITAGDVVDLGLPSGLKWASCNIGADSPCESGLLFQFGRVDGYAYGDTNHEFRTTTQNTADTGSQFIPATTSGKTYAAGAVLEAADDAAYVATNGAMRMPTTADIDELLAGTTNQWVTCTVLGEDHASHNIYGRFFTSKTNGATLFIPAAGAFNGPSGSFFGTGSRGFVWSSSVHPYLVNNGSYLEFDSGNCYCYNSYGRYLGFPVRGVKN